MRLLLIAALLFGLTACTQSRGFDRVHMRSQISSIQVDQKEEMKVQPSELPGPFKLAVYFAPSNLPPSDQYGWNWKGEDTEKVLSLQQDLKAKNIVSEIVSLPSSLVAGDNLEAIRSAAARAGADAVLVVNGVSDIDRYNNSLGPTYALLITPFFVPGTEVDSLFLVNATMWDVRNESLYMSVETEGMAKETAGAFQIYEKPLIHQAKSNALTGLRNEIAIRLNKMNKG